MDNQYARLTRLKEAMRTDWAGVAEALGITVSWIMYIKSGRKHLGRNTLFRLEAVERLVGLSPPQRLDDLIRPPEQVTLKKNSNYSRHVRELPALYATVPELQGMLERAREAGDWASVSAIAAELAQRETRQ